MDCLELIYLRGAICWLEGELRKYNPYHDERGRFTSPDRAGSISQTALHPGDELFAPDGSGTVEFVGWDNNTREQVIAGKGRDREIDIIDSLVNDYGGDPKEWVKVKRKARILQFGEIGIVDVHWFQEPSVGVVNVKIKREKDGEWIQYEG